MQLDEGFFHNAKRPPLSPPKEEEIPKIEAKIILLEDVISIKNENKK